VEKLLHVSFTDPRASMPVYTITTHTSNMKNAGTDAKVGPDLCMASRGRKGGSRGGLRSDGGKVPRARWVRANQVTLTKLRSLLSRPSKIA